MANDFSFTLNVDSNVKEILAAKEEAVIKAMQEIALTAEAFAKVECPVDTGNLRNSITHDSDEKSAVVGTNVEYAAYVELGTSNPNYPRQPYLQPAFENHMAQYQDILNTNLKG